MKNNQRFKFKKVRDSLTVIYGMSFCFFAIIGLRTEQSTLFWIVTGYFLGAFVIQLISNPLIDSQDKMIRSLFRVIDSYEEMFDKTKKEVKKK